MPKPAPKPPLTYSISPLSAVNDEGDAGTTAFTFTVTRSSGTGKGTVAYAVTGAQANDFAGGVFPSGVVTFRAGETSKTLTILVQGDTVLENDENFSVTLSNPNKGTVVGGPATGTIQNDELYQVAIAPLSAVKPEGDSGTTGYTFTVSRTGGTAGAVTVDYAVTGTGGLDAADFGGALPSGTVTIPDGQSSVTLTIDVSGDTTLEDDEDFTVTLSNPSANAAIATATAEGTIQNDEPVPIQRVSVSSTGTQGSALSFEPAISADGRYVTFMSFAFTLVPDDDNGDYDTFVRDLQTHTTERASVSSAEVQAFGSPGSSLSTISGDGRYVAFASAATNLVASDTNFSSDIFLRDRTNGTTERISVSSAEVQADGESVQPWISANGSFVAFKSVATNLVASDTNGGADIFLRDLAGGTTERISVNSNEDQATGPLNVAPVSEEASTSADGDRVAFTSNAANLAEIALGVFGDLNSSNDIFVRDRSDGTTTLVSVNSAGQGASFTDGSAPPGGADNGEPMISGNGRYVVFESFASNFVAGDLPGEWDGDTNGAYDIFRHDLVTGVTERVSVSDSEAQAVGGPNRPDSLQASISDDGRYIAFASIADNLVAGETGVDNWDVFVRDMVLGTTTRVSVSADGTQANGASTEPSISGDGRYVTFRSSANNLVAGDTNGQDDVFVVDGALQGWWFA
jgi:hypothetical protein